MLVTMTKSDVKRWGLLPPLHPENEAAIPATEMASKGKGTVAVRISLRSAFITLPPTATTNSRTCHSCYHRLKSAVPYTPPDEPCGPRPPAPPPRPSISPSRVLSLPPCPQTPTATTPS
nr:unnamed protein product [Spirometra erinaceieuropaei]